MKFARSPVYILLCLAVMFVGCASTPEETATGQEAEAPPEPVDGQTAFYRMFTAARQWAPDAQGLRLESIRIEEVEPDGGKFGAWRASFYSPGHQRMSTYNFAVVEVGGKLRKGVFQDHEESYSPAGRAHPWPAIALKINSEDALETALKQPEAKKYVAANPDVPVMILLEQTDRHRDPAWRIIWGHSVSTSAFSVFVDASTGEFLEIMH
jgi:hypothetical protein